MIDGGIILGIIAILISLIGTTFSIYYTRKTLGKKTKLEETSNKIRKTVEEIWHVTRKLKAYPKFCFNPIYDCVDDVLRHMHDNNLENLEICIKPLNLSVELWYNKEKIEKRLISPETSFHDLSSLLHYEQKNFYRFMLNFDCRPRILKSDSALMHIFIQTGRLTKLYESLRKEHDVISAFDNKILEDLGSSIETIEKNLFESFTKEHKLVFTGDMKSGSIFDIFLNQISNRKSIIKALDFMSKEICERLSNVQRELFLKS